MRLFTCPNCKRQGVIGSSDFVRCGCKAKFRGDALAPHVQEIPDVSPKIDLPCSHRGQTVDKVDCGCDGDANVYACDIHGRCLIRPLIQSQWKGVTCSDCESRRHPVEDLAIVTTHWNPFGFSKPVETYYRWQASIHRKIRVMEAVYGGRQRDIPSSVYFEAGFDSVLWQKERLINLAIKSLPKQVKWVAWIDHDLIFENEQWAEDAVVQLSRGLDVVQLFDQVKYTDRDGDFTETRPGAAAMLAQGQEPDCAPGGAWMASRKWLESIGGLYDLNICGGGDATFFQAITGFHTRYLTRQTPALREDCLRYVSRVNKAKWGFVKGSVVHLWHGDRANRQYVSRDAILDQWSFDPQKHLRTTQNGLLAWSDLAPEGLRRAVAEYFSNRREDG